MIKHPTDPFGKTFTPCAARKDGEVEKDWEVIFGERMMMMVMKKMMMMVYHNPYISLYNWVVSLS